MLEGAGTTGTVGAEGEGTTGTVGATLPGATAGAAVVAGITAGEGSSWMTLSLLRDAPQEDAVSQKRRFMQIDASRNMIRQARYCTVAT